MGLVLVWSNLSGLFLPFAIALTAASLLAIPLRSAAERSGLPRSREPCVGCRAEPNLLRTGACPERCVVNALVPVGIGTFVATTTLAILVLLDPSALARYVLPMGDSYGTAATALDALVVATNAGASLLLAAFFLQDEAGHREGLLQGASAAALGSMAVGVGLPSLAGRWVGTLLPLSLSALLLGLAIEWRARRGRPAFGLRTIALATLPLFLITLVAIVRIAQIAAEAG